MRRRFHPAAAPTRHRASAATASIVGQRSRQGRALARSAKWPSKTNRSSGALRSRCLPQVRSRSDDETTSRCDWCHLDRGGKALEPAAGPDISSFNSSLSPDGRYLAYSQNIEGTPGDIWLLDLQGVCPSDSPTTVRSTCTRSGLPTVNVSHSGRTGRVDSSCT